MRFQCRFRFRVFIGLLCASGIAPARAAAEIGVEIWGREASVWVQARRQRVRSGETALSLLERVLRERRLPFELENGTGILSIRGLTASTVSEDGATRYYGWCYRIDGVSPREMPGERKLGRAERRMTWFYGFMESREGAFAECVPVSSGLSFRSEPRLDGVLVQ